MEGVGKGGKVLPVGLLFGDVLLDEGFCSAAGRGQIRI